LRPAGIDITCSIGVTTIEPSEEIDLERAFRQADKAVYRAKKRGRNCVSFQGYIRRKRRPGTAAG
jgi:diguanylate cyclase (GGDEF)-like protein